MSNMEYLLLPQNRLTGPIPAELGELSRLQWLMLQENDLSGEVPAELGRLSTVLALYLQGNNLAGPLPSSFTALRQLQVLDISNNAGLCAPADDDFQAWLLTVPGFFGETCAVEPVPAVPIAGLVAAALLVFGLGANMARRRRGG